MLGFTELNYESKINCLKGASANHKMVASATCLAEVQGLGWARLGLGLGFNLTDPFSSNQLNSFPQQSPLNLPT
jgi:hypothetical protein